MSDHPTGPVARELTPAEHQERRDLCFDLMQQIKEGLTKGRVAMWETARALHEFDEENGWSALGYETLAHFLADPEVGMRKSMYYSLVRTYRKTVVLRQVPVETMQKLDMTKVDVVLGKVEACEVKMEEALDDVEALGFRDLREKYGGKPELPPGGFSERSENDAPADDSQRRENDPPGDGEELVAVPRADLAALHQRARVACEGSRRDRDRFAREASTKLFALLGGGDQ